MARSWLRSVFKFLFVEWVGYRRPPVLTDADHEARRDMAKRLAHLEGVRGRRAVEARVEAILRDYESLANPRLVRRLDGR